MLLHQERRAETQSGDEQRDEPGRISRTRQQAQTDEREQDDKVRGVCEDAVHANAEGEERINGGSQDGLLDVGNAPGGDVYNRGAGGVNDHQAHVDAGGSLTK